MRFSQKIKRVVFLLSLSSSILLEQNAKCQQNPDNIAPPSPSSELSGNTNVDIGSDIVIDGIPTDKAWASVPFQTIKKENCEIKYKIYSGNSCMYLLVVFPSDKEKRKHRPWQWDPLKQIYLSGPEKEDELYVLWTEFPLDAIPGTSAEKADIWIWRAARTDPAGFADDYYFINESLSSKPDNRFADLRQDNGESCWFNSYFAAFAGNELPRYGQRLPEGSLADVKAKGIWNSGIWTVAFSRKINTGNPDDIDFGGTPRLSISFSLSPPEIKSLKLSEFKRSPGFNPPETLISNQEMDAK